MPGLFNRKARFAKIFYRKTFRFLPKKRSSNTTQSLSSDSFSEPEAKPVYSIVKPRKIPSFVNVGKYHRAAPAKNNEFLHPHLFSRV
ncbi:hypothetical protein BBC0244_023430 [Bartonella apihabitans]|nr:hypothetical protein BBC0244_023430 [Bartonella apihabitans]